MNPTNKKSAGGSRLALLVLFIGFFLAPQVQAQSLDYELQSDGTIILEMDTLDFTIPGPSNVGYCIFNSQFATTTINCGVASAGIYTGGSISTTYGAWITQFAPSNYCTASSTVDNTLTCDLDYGLSTQTGDFYLAVFQGSVKNFYYPLTRNADYTWEPRLPPQQIGFNSVTNTRFTDLSVTGTSTVVVDVEYFLDLLEIDRTVTEYNPTQVAFRTSLRPSSTFSSVSESIDNTTAGTSSVSTSFVGLVDGTYDLNITFANNGTLFGQTRPFEKSYIYTEFTIASGTLASVGNIEFYDGLTPPNPEGNQPCGITDLGGCIINAVMYLVYPSSASLNEFNELYETMSGKFPFAYFTDFNDSVSAVFTAPTTEEMALTVPFGDYGDLQLISAEQIEAVPLTATIRTLLGALIWFMLGATIYRRTYRIFNQQTA